MSTVTRTSAAILDDLVSALRRGDLARAERAFEEGSIDSQSVLRLADLNVRRQRWADAAWLFDRAGDLPAGAAFKRNLCRNMACLAEHRPSVCALLAGLQPSADVTIAASSTGHPTLAARQSGGELAILSAGNRPLAAAEVALQQLRPALAKGLAIGLAGIGDGYLLYRIAIEETKLLLTTQVPVFVIEPNPQIALHAMMIHDYSGPQGPIAQQRFNWYVGPEWLVQLRQTAAHDPYLGTPAVTIGFTADAAEVREGLATLAKEIDDRDTAARANIDAYYASYDPSQLACLLAPDAPRKPRVMLPTTRFSTVLQYSNQDVAHAFERLGWDVLVLIEPSPAHRLYQCGLRRDIEAFKPDLVMQIDHLRHEHNGMFPANLPFACWAQDHLPNLVGDAGKHLGPTDFVLTDGVPTYIRDFQYPASQCIGLTKLTSVKQPSGTTRDVLERVEDVVFVSNASRTCDSLLAEKLAEKMHPVCRDAVENAASQLLESFKGNTPITTYVRVRELVERVTSASGFGFDRDAVRTIASWLYHPYCDATYRQQAMTWAADACRELGLSFGLYGKGWESHPTLSAFARGPIVNGPALHELTRRSLVNLQVVPYLCLHQRVLDGLSAGGFFLIREHISDVAPQAMIDLLVAHGAGDALSVPAARSALADADHVVQAEFESILQSCRDCLCNSGVEDPIEYAQSLRQIGFLVPGIGVLPRFAEVAFTDADSLRQRIRRFMQNSDERRELAELQRQSVTDRFTYAAGIRRVVATIAERLSGGLPNRLTQNINVEALAA